MREKVETTLNEIGPSLLADRGNVELVDVKDGVVKLKLTGACSGCHRTAMTLYHGITRVIKDEMPEIKGVLAI